MYIPETVLAYLCQRHMYPPRCEMRRRFGYGPQLNGLELLTYMLFLSIFYNRKRFAESKTGSRPTKYQLAIAAIHSYSGMHSTTRESRPKNLLPKVSFLDLSWACFSCFYRVQWTWKEVVGDFGAEIWCYYAYALLLHFATCTMHGQILTVSVVHIRIHKLSINEFISHMHKLSLNEFISQIYNLSLNEFIQYVVLFGVNFFGAAVVGILFGAVVIDCAEPPSPSK